MPSTTTSVHETPESTDENAVKEALVAEDSREGDREDNITFTRKEMGLKKALDQFGWRAVMSGLLEVKQLFDRGVWENIDPTSLNKRKFKKIVAIVNDIEVKYLANGEFEKLKARLIAGGHTTTT